MEHTCKKCGETKPIEEFYKDRNNKDGYSYHCKICRSKADKEYRELNKAKLQNRSKVYYKKNRKNIIAKSKKNYRLNKEDHNKKGRLRYYLNRDHHLRKCKEYRESHKIEYSIQNRIYRELHKEECINRGILYRQKNQIKIKNKKIEENVFNRKNLTDRYVMSGLRQLTGTSLNILRRYPELIEAKRIQLKLKRLSNEKCNRT